MRLLSATILGLTLLSISLFSQADIWYAKGQQSMQKKEYEKAIEHYTRAIELSPGVYRFYEKRGLAYLYRERSVEAIEDFNIAIGINAKKGELYNNRGLAYSFQGDLAKAMSDFNKAISIDPNFGQAFLNRGSIYLQYKNNKAALSDFDRAAKLDPKNPEIFYNRGRMYYSMDQYKKAIDDFTTSINLGIKLGKIYYNRGNAYFKQRKYKEAIDDYSKAISFDANDLEAINNRAMAYDKAGDKKKAAADRKLLADKRGGDVQFPPVETIKFKTYTDKEKRFWIDLPEDWHVQTFVDKEVSELIIAREDPKKGNYATGVKLVFNKTMNDKYKVKGMTDLLTFWEGSNQKNADDYFDYRIYSKKTMSRGNYKGSLNLVHIKVSSESYFLQLYELVLASDTDLFYAYFQCPQVQFEYYKQIFDKAISSFKIR